MQMITRSMDAKMNIFVNLTQKYLINFQKYVKNQTFCLSDIKPSISFQDLYEITKHSQFEFWWVEPNKDFVDFLTKLLKDCNIEQITSVGCGNGHLELLLSEHFKVHGVDRFSRKEIPSIVKQYITYSFMKNDRSCLKLKFSKSEALLLSWPILLNFMDSFKNYTGPCIVVYGDDTCEPYPPKDLIEFPGWKIYHQSKFKLNRDADLFVFVRDI
jgi:hypothetical protein